MFTKTKFSLLFALIFISVHSFAENPFILKNLKLKKIGIHMGMDKDLLSWRNMQGEYFSSLVIDDELSDLAIDYRNSKYNQYSALCGIPNIRASLVFQLPKNNRELHVGLIGVFDRVYGNNFAQYLPESSEWNKHKNYRYSLHSHEIAIEVNYVATKKIEILKDVFQLNLYGLLGTNGGYQFDNNISIEDNLMLYREWGAPRDTWVETMSNNQQNINVHEKAFDAINHRVYAGIGFGLVFLNRLELGFNSKLGSGYRYHFSNRFTGTKFSSFDFSAKWILK